MYLLGMLAVVSALLACFLAPLLRRWFIKRGWVDRPDGARKTHLEPVPRSGGATIAVAYFGTYAAAAAVGWTGLARVHADFALILSVLPGAALIFAIGLLDDTKGLPPWIKLSGQIVAGVMVFLGGVHVGILHWFMANDWRLSLPVTLFWLLLCTNAFNLIDGMDGLSGGLSLFALLTLVCYGVLGRNLALLFAVIPLAGALIGFLPFNFNPASVFLGDSGSYTIGFLLGCYSAVWSEKAATVLGITAPLMAFAVPLADVALVVARRFLQQKPIFHADRLHIHHRLLERGLTPRAVVAVLYAAAGVGAVLAVVTTVLNRKYAGFAFLLFCFLVCLAVKKLGYLEFVTAGRIALRGTFRQVLRSEMILHNTWARLNAASTPFACWQVLRTTASELGFCRVGMKLDNLDFFESFDDADSTSSWTITIPLKDRGHVELAHRFDQDTIVMTVVPLTDLLHRCLTLQPERPASAEPPGPVQHSAPWRKALSA